MKNASDSAFQPGNTCGRGRPKGSRNKATIALQEMLDGHGESITRKCALLALQGDPTSMRLCMERLIAPKKDHAVKFKCRPTTTAAEVAAAVDAILQDAARGQLTPAEGQMIIASLEGKLRVIEKVEYEARMNALEARSEADATEGRRLIFFKDPEAPPRISKKLPQRIPKKLPKRILSSFLSEGAQNRCATSKPDCGDSKRS
jgi:hypothetical protein